MSGIHLRQRILDYVNTHQHASPAEVSQGMGIMQDTVSRAMFDMCHNGEMVREKSMDERGQPYRYEALVQTASKTVYKKRTPKPRKESQAVGKVSKPGYYSQRGGGWLSQHDSGGQGAVRGVVGVQSSAGLV